MRELHECAHGMMPFVLMVLATALQRTLTTGSNWPLAEMQHIQKHIVSMRDAAHNGKSIM
jgi:hypothetical protein